MDVSDGAGRPPTGAAGRRRGDDELGRLLADHGDVVYRVARSIVRDPALADDVVQETMIKAWRSLPDRDGEPVPRAWLLKVARTTAISLLRTRRDEVRAPDQLPAADGPGVASAERTAVGRVALDEMWAALERLDETSRTIVVLRELSGLSYEEIADVIDVPLATVKTRLFRARRALQIELREWSR